MYDLLGAFQDLGMNLPQNEELPQIVYHDIRNSFPGETLKEACALGERHFGEPVKLVFVLLPDTGNSLLSPFSLLIAQLPCTPP